MQTFTSAIVLVFFLLAFQTKAQSPDSTLSAAPNPFAQSTQLTLHQLSRDTVSLKVYNITGQVVAHFLDSLVLSGTFTVGFQADSLPAGAYIARLNQNDETKTLKLFKMQGPLGDELGAQVDQPLQICPNPTYDRVKIATEEKLTGIVLYDLQGRELHRWNPPGSTLNLSSFSKGKYLLLIKTKQQAYSKILIKK